MPTTNDYDSHMKKLPQNIIALFLSEDLSAETVLLDWIESQNVTYIVADGSFKSRPPVVAHFASCVAKSGKVNFIDLSDNNLGDLGPLVATNLTQQGSAVNSVVLNSNNLRQYAIGTVKNLTHENSQVEIILVENNGIAESAPAVAEILARPTSKVTHVSLALNNIAGHAPATVENLTHPDSMLTTLNLSRNGIDSQNAILTAKRLKKLHSVDFSLNCSPQFLPQISKIFTEEDSTLTILTLTSNYQNQAQLNDLYFPLTLMILLSRSSNLEQLTLGRNALKPEHVNLCSKLIKGNSKITRFDNEGRLSKEAKEQLNFNNLIKLYGAMSRVYSIDYRGDSLVAQALLSARKALSDPEEYQKLIIPPNFHPVYETVIAGTKEEMRLKLTTRKSETFAPKAN